MAGENINGIQNTDIKLNERFKAPKFASITNLSSHQTTIFRSAPAYDYSSNDNIFSNFDNMFNNLFDSFLGQTEQPQEKVARNDNTETRLTPKEELIEKIISSIINADSLDNENPNDGSFYTNLIDPEYTKNDPELSDLGFISQLDIADNGKNDGSIYKLIDILKNQNSTPQEKSHALRGIQDAHRNYVSKNYDALITGKTNGIGNENFITKNEKTGEVKPWNIPDKKPDFIKNEEDWKKIKQLDPQMQAATIELYRRAAEKGLSFTISSGLRSNEEQKAIYASARPGYAAKPGSSQHELGRAIDIKSANKKGLGKIWEDMGFKWGGNFNSNKEDWHFDLRKTA